MDDLRPFAERAFERFEAFGKVILATAAICYVTGLLTVNLYLRNFSFSDYSLLRTRFVLTGAVGLAPAIIAISSSYAAYTTMRRWPLAHNNKAFAITGAIGIFILLCGFAAGWLFYYLFGTDPGVSRRHVVLLFVLALLALWVVLLCSSLLRRVDVQQWARQIPSYIIVVTLLLALTYLAYVYLFSQSLYPAIAGQLGGGRPHWVQLVLFRETSREAEQLGLEIDPDQELLTVPYPLLWEGEATYLLLIPNPPDPQWAAQVDKKLVAAVLVKTWPQPDKVFIPEQESVYRLPSATPATGTPTPSH